MRKCCSLILQVTIETISNIQNLICRFKNENESTVLSWDLIYGGMTQTWHVFACLQNCLWVNKLCWGCSLPSIYLYHNYITNTSMVKRRKGETLACFLQTALLNLPLEILLVLLCTLSQISTVDDLFKAQQWESFSSRHAKQHMCHFPHIHHKCDIANI